MSSYDIFQADYDELEKIAQLFAEAAQGIDEMLQEVRGGRQNLEGEWVGLGSDAFFSEMDGEVLPVTERLRDALSEASEATRRMSTTISAAEEAAAALFRQDAQSPAVSPTKNLSPATSGKAPPQTGLIRRSPTPRVTKPLSPIEEELVAGLGIVGLTTDVMATSLSGVGVMLEGTLALVDTPMSPVGDLIGIGTYGATIDRVETGLSGLGFLATAASDLIQGNTYLDWNEGEVVVGQDTLVSGVAFSAGYLSPEAVLDTSINAALLTYDVQGMDGDPVYIAGHRWELRFGSQGLYLVGYPPLEALPPE